jgi:homopolymeric O-antigen transport system permease protein
VSARALGWLGVDRAPLPGALWTLVRTDFKTRYRPTIGGFVWALLKPLAMFVVLLAVFSLVFHSEPQYRLNLIIGLFVWDFFAEATKVGLVSLQAKRFLLTKARFPTWILVVTSAANATLTLLVFGAIILGFLAASGRPPSPPAVGLFALYLVHLLAIVLGFSLATSVLFLRYRDLNQVWDVVIQAGFFVAPIVYPLGVLPERIHAFIYLWPPTPIIQFSRLVLVEGVAPTARAHVLLSLGTLAILGAGALIHRWYGPRAAEYL